MSCSRAMSLRALLSVLLLLIGGCSVSRAYLGEPVQRVKSSEGYRRTVMLAERPRDDLLVIVSLSGGGMRASAMAYGLLEQLAADRLPQRQTTSRMIDQIDVLSAVSGGAIPAAYYTLYGDRLFEDFIPRFLGRDVGAALRRDVLLKPRNWLRLASSEYSRGDLYADFFDQQLFNGATFGDLGSRPDRPFLVIQATDIALAGRFEFTQDGFDPLCLDLSRYPLARAVAASSSVPAVLAPITLRSNAGQCGYVLPAWVDTALGNGDHSTRTHFRASIAKARSDASRIAYLHLVDGALSDNLGARVTLDILSDEPAVFASALAPTRRPRVVYIALNAGDPQIMRIGARRKAPDALEMLRLMGTVPVDRYSAESKTLLREALENWSRQQGAELYYIELEIESLRENPQFAYLVELPTSLVIDQKDALRLRCATREMLHYSADYRRLLEDLGATRGGITGC